MKKTFFFAVCLAVLCTAPLFAGPRWWWNDVPVAETPQDSMYPDIALPVGIGAPVRAIFVVWQEIPAGETDNEIYLAASFDEGCSFCGPIRITNNDYDDRYPRVAAAVGNTDQLRIQIAHEQFDTGSSVGHTLVSYNVNTLDVNNLSCATLMATNWSKKQLDAAGTPHTCSHPDIAATVVNPTNPGNAAPAFAVAWQEYYPMSGGKDDILVSADRIGNGSYQATPRNFTNSPGVYDERPAVFFVNGAGGMGTLAVGVAYASGANPLGASPKQILFQTAMVDTAGVGAPGGADTLNITPAITAPALDAGVQPFGLMDATPFWLGASWMTPGSSGNPAGIFYSAELLDFSRGGVVSPWLIPPANLLPTNGKTGVGGQPPAVAVLPYPAAGTALGFWDFWLDFNNPTQSEVYYRAGVLDESGTPVVNPDLFPIPPGGVSVNTQLTGIAPARVAGTRPDLPAADAQSNYPPCNADTTFVVFPDNSSGNYDIFFKRIDTCVDAGFSVDIPECLPPGGGVTVTWPPKQCPAATERLTSIKVYQSSVSGGPYTLVGSPAVDATSQATTGLAPNANYCYVVLFEDEAGNAAPSPFNPDIVNNPPPRGEACITTPTVCVGALASTKTWVDTNGAPLLPGDTVTGTITVNNPGTADTTNVIVTDTVDTAHLQNVATLDPDGSLAGSIITWTTGQTLTPGGSLSRSFTADVKCNAGTPPAPIADGTQIPNATYDADCDQSPAVPGTPPTPLTVNRPVLTIAKTMDTANPAAGQPVAYTITVCNTGSAPETGVVIRDTVDQTWLDPTTLSAPGGTWVDPYIQWTIASLATGPCQTIQYNISLRGNWIDERVCNSAVISSTGGVYASCGWALPAAAQACLSGAGNQLLKNCTAPTPLPPVKVIPAPPGQTTDTGVTDTTNPLCFYGVQQSTGPNSLKITKSAVADTMDIYY
jgi:uncharacterized repeat protein (TIGR01451 family)